MIPEFRSLGEDLTLGTLMVISVMALLAGSIAGVYGVRQQRARRNVWRRFEAQALEKGLKQSQCRFLMRLARGKDLRNPLVLLNSLVDFDRYVGGHAARLMERDPEEHAKTLKNISRIRVLLGFDELPQGQPMRTTRQLDRGQRLEVRRLDPDGEDAPYVSCVVGARDDRYIAATVLLHKDERHVREWATGDRLEARMWLWGRNEYGFETPILAMDDAARRIVLGHSEGVVSNQSRQFFRLDINFGIILFATPAAGYADRGVEGLDLENAVRIEGMVVNISGGGMGVKTRDRVPEGSLLVVDPDFYGDFPLAGVLCQMAIEPDPEKDIQDLRLSFVDLPQEVEAGIVRGINQHQLGLQPGEEEDATRVAADD